MVLGLESSVIHPIWWTNQEKKQVIYLYVDWKIYTNSSKSNQNVLIDRNSGVMWVGHLQNKLLNVGNNQPTSKQTEKCYVYQGCKIDIPFIKSWNNVGWKKAKLLQVCQNNGTVHV